MPIASGCSHCAEARISEASTLPIRSSIEVLQELRGQTFEVEGLENAFSTWPFKANEHVNEVRREVEIWLDRTFPNHPKLKKSKAADYGLFGATWWPLAGVARLRIATYLAVWLFLLDDEIDMVDGKFYGDLDLAAKYREDTLDFVNGKLGLAKEVSATGNAVIDSFDVIGEALKTSCSIRLSYFMEKSKIEQSLRLHGQIISLDNFWRFRLGTSAVRVVLCLNEYCLESKLPTNMLHRSEMETLWDLTNINICLVNDLLSLKKEIQHGSAESLIPILYVAAARPDIHGMSPDSNFHPQF